MYTEVIMNSPVIHRTTRFPKHITLEKVHEYTDAYSDIHSGDNILFDLSETTSIHSSFIGFLLHTHHQCLKKGAEFQLDLSLTADRLLIMLNLDSHFSEHIIRKATLKSA